MRRLVAGEASNSHQPGISLRKIISLAEYRFDAESADWSQETLK
jgi:hypothetical protein